MINRRDMKGDVREEKNGQKVLPTFFFNADEVLKKKDEKKLMVGVKFYQGDKGQCPTPKAQDSLSYNPDGKVYPNKNGKINYKDKMEIPEAKFNEILEQGTAFKSTDRDGNDANWVAFAGDLKLQNSDPKDPNKKVPKNAFEHYHFGKIEGPHKVVNTKAHFEATAQAQADKKAARDAAKETEAETEDQIEV